MEIFFDYRVGFLLKEYLYSDFQVFYRRFIIKHVHDMYNVKGFNLVNFRSTIDKHIVKVKIYQELCHEVFSVIYKYNLENMSPILRTICSKQK